MKYILTFTHPDRVITAYSKAEAFAMIAKSPHRFESLAEYTLPVDTAAS